MNKKEHIENYILNQWIVIPCRHREKIPLIKSGNRKEVIQKKRFNCGTRSMKIITSEC